MSDSEQGRYGWPVEQVDCPLCKKSGESVCYHTPREREEARLVRSAANRAKKARQRANRHRERREALGNGSVWV